MEQIKSQNQIQISQHKVIKLSCGDIVIGVVTTDTFTEKRIMKQPWQMVKVTGGYSMCPYEVLIFGNNHEVKDLIINPDHIVYERELVSFPDLKKAYFERSMENSGIVV